MFKILEASDVGFNVRQFVIQAPRIARKQRPGQFVIVRLHDQGERIPLAIHCSDPAAGTITLIVQAIGRTTALLNCLEAGDSILDLVGPLGNASEIKNYGTTVIVSDGLDTATALPTAQALKDAGNHVIFLEGAASREFAVFDGEMRKASDEAHILTEDGSYGEKGVVTGKLSELIAGERKINFVFAVGPVAMMHDVSKITASHGIKTTVSLKAIMLDGAGMCGSCRVLVNNENKFACVDGPEFDASAVNFDTLLQRATQYHDKDCESLHQFEAHKAEQLAQLRAELAEHEREESSHAATELNHAH